VLIFDKQPSKNDYRKKQNICEKVDSKNETDNNHHLQAAPATAQQPASQVIAPAQHCGKPVMSGSQAINGPTKK